MFACLAIIGQWMDGASGRDHGCSFDKWRYGASSESMAINLCSVVQDFRDYISARCGSKSHFKMPKRWEEVNLVSKRTQRVLRQCKVVALGWRPHERGDEDWGGRFGKNCGHNETCMFFARPFAPMEVLNTHVCSQHQPAPGNQGFDGCLEFLSCQCRFFGKCFSVWDNEAFHYIGTDGVDRPLAKKALLDWSLNKLKVYVPNMRALTVASDGSISPMDIIETIDMLLAIAAGKCFFDGLGLGKFNRTIVSYLLVGSSTSWAKCTAQ
jgi:hypothetical protein